MVVLVQNDRLYEFMLEELGGEQEVFRKYIGKQIEDLASEDQTLEALFASAREQGLEDALWKTRLTDLANTIRPLAPASRSDGVRAPDQSASRITGEEKKALHERILTFIKHSPWCSNADVAGSEGVDGRTMGRYLRELKATGRIKSVGEKASTRYALPDEQSSPPGTQEPPKAVPPHRRQKRLASPVQTAPDKVSTCCSLPG